MNNMPKKKTKSIKKKQAPVEKPTLEEPVVKEVNWVERNGVPVEVTPRIERKMERRPDKYTQL